ncbi:MAG: response regulator transcription factor [Verrucomicrobia bacterium]|nr:response regulator transcription factor [Verrucomicrobiota bacterium]MBI3871104.1 response regulator transcription factor [Verrucomicrobiota bacterium]
MRILLIEDDVGVAQFMILGLQKHGYNVDSSTEAGRGLELALSADYDLIILDLFLPDRDGIDVLTSLRAAGRATRILLLTSRSSVQDRIQGLELGADDFLPKPFDFDELLAHVRALLRRTPLDVSATVLKMGDLELDARRKYVTRGGREIHLPAKQFAILEHLMRHPNQVVSRTDLAQKIWASEPGTATNNVIDVTVHLLRESVDRGFPLSMIQTVRGVGYRLGGVSSPAPDLAT